MTWTTGVTPEQHIKTRKNDQISLKATYRRKKCGYEPIFLSKSESCIRLGPVQTSIFSHTEPNTFN